MSKNSVINLRKCADASSYLPGLIKWADKTFSPFLSLLTAVSTKVVNKPSGWGYYSIALNQAANTSLFLCSGYWFSIKIIGIETPFPINDLGNICVDNEHYRYISADIASNETLIKMEIICQTPNKTLKLLSGAGRHNLRGFSILIFTLIDRLNLRKTSLVQRGE